VTTSIKIVAILTAKPGRESALETLLRGMVPLSRAESGNLRYDLWQDNDNAGRFVLDELYKDNGSVASHRATPHFQNYLSQINDLAERTAVVVHSVDVAAG
jgi:quinol monooxygenase YgiN